MKLLLTILVSCFLLAQTSVNYKRDNNAEIVNNKICPVEKNLDFGKQVLPVLVKNCSPCHFPGGKMYERLPFDKDTTIINQGEKILKRIGNSEKNSVIREFILQNKNGLSAISHI
ncbi:MAG: hypothetical protein Q8941_15090 [Bacteroidota bacterium]|nr:hypothetical protein [Bacteroidota bacterium]